jgi:integrase
MHLKQGKANGKDVWIVDLGYLNGRRRRLYFPVKADALAILAEAKLQQKKAGDFWTSLKPAERVEAADIYLKAQSVGMTLTQLWDNHVAKGGASVTLKSLKDAVKETISVKIQQKCRPRYVDGLEHYLKMFIRKREHEPVSSIKPRDIETWFVGRNESPAVRNANLGRLSSMFAIAVKNGWCATNPCDSVVKPKVERKAAEIMTLAQTARALLWTAKHRPRMLAYLSLSLFSGVRPEELEKIAWDSIKESGGKSVVVISAEASKVRQRRITTMEPAGKRWLALSKSIGSALPVATSTRKRYIHDLRDALRMDHWTQDILRHTAASHLLALRKDAAAVALELGNSASILLRHYRALVSDVESEKFWNLIPNERIIRRIAGSRA